MIIRKGFYSIIIILLITIQLVAQNNYQKKSLGEKFIEDGKIFLLDAGSYFTSPLQFSSTEWIYASGLTGGTYMLMHSDETLRNTLGRKTIKTLNGDIWDIPTYYGFVGYANAMSLTTYGIGLLSGENEVRKLGRMMFQSLSYGGITVMVLRTLFGRERPYSGKGPWAFTGFSTDNEVQSFPSGHVTVAFSFSTVLAEYFDTIASRIIFYGMASLTAYARILNNQHWVSDVLIGALIGLGSGLHVINEENNRNNETGKLLSFYISHNRIGIHYNFR